MTEFLLIWILLHQFVISYRMNRLISEVFYAVDNDDEELDE